MTEILCPDEVINRIPEELGADWYEGKADNLPEFVSELHNNPESGLKAFRDGENLKPEEDTKGYLTYGQFCYIADLAVDKPDKMGAVLELRDFLNEIIRVRSPQVFRIKEGGGKHRLELQKLPDRKLELDGEKVKTPHWYVFGLAYLIDVWTGERDLRRCAYEKCENIFHPTRKDKRFCSSNCRKYQHALNQ